MADNGRLLFEAETWDGRYAKEESTSQKQYRE
jgi:hypothetical protein